MLSTGDGIRLTGKMELLLFKWDHSTQSIPTPSIAQIAALPKPYDLVIWRAPGWRWGVEELANPWFRILVWHEADSRELDTLLSPLLGAIGANMRSATYWQYRGFHLDMAHQLVSDDVKAWWADDTRATARHILRPGPMTVAAIKRERPAIPVSPGP